MNIMQKTKHKLIGVVAVGLTGTLFVTLAFAGNSSNGLSQLDEAQTQLESVEFLDDNEQVPFSEHEPPPPDPSGPTLTVDEDEVGSICMQRIFGGDQVSGSNRLNCTANDIRLAEVNKDQVWPKECTEGSYFTLTAVFNVVVTANERYSTGIYLRKDGGSTARGDVGPGGFVSGDCSLSVLGLGYNDFGDKWEPGIDLNGDSCGDLTGGTHRVVVEIPDVLCQGVEVDGEKVLKLPYCTTWHSNQSTQCEIEPEDPYGPFNPFYFHPETRSKCKCDDGFTVPVVVRPPEGDLIKQVVQADVTYRVEVENTGGSTVKITELVDDPHGDLCGGNPGILESNCPDLCNEVELEPGDDASCTFKVSYSAAQMNGIKSNTVTAVLQDVANEDNEATLEGSAAVELRVIEPQD
jgi:hypothetical protein